MRKAVGLIALVLIALLIVCSEKAIAAADNALSIWWSAVVPSLFPFFVLTGLLQDSGMLSLSLRIMARLFPRHQGLQAAAPAFFLGALSGYPTGARISAMLGRDALARSCNLCSPIFLLGVISVNLAHDIRLFLPIAIAHYASAILLLPLSFRFPKQRGQAKPVSQPEQKATSGILNRIAEGTTAMLSIGGCIVFFSVISALADEIGLLPLLARAFQLVGVDRGTSIALMKSVLEMTSGCAAIASLAIPLPLAAALYAAATSFGGLCIFAQSKMVAVIDDSLRYLLQKALQAVLAAGIAFLLTPLFIRSDIPVMQIPSPDTLMENAASALSLLIASLVGVTGTYLFSVCLQLWFYNKHWGKRKKGEA